jgi:hypothetical protein
VGNKTGKEEVTRKGILGEKTKDKQASQGVK